MSAIDAFHLPGIDDDDIQEWQELGAPGLSVRAPLLAPEGLQRVLRRLRAAQLRLRRIPVRRIISAIDEVAARLLDPADSLRHIVETALPLLTGYSPAMVRLGLDRMAGDWRTAALERVLHAELGGPAPLDGIVARHGRRIIALPYPLVTHVFAGNVPGVAVTSLVRALLVRSASLGKTAAGEPLLPALFARALADVDAEVGAAIAVCYWPGGHDPLERIALAETDALVVYGGAAALADIRRRTPAQVPVIDHGPRLSVGFVARNAADDDDDARALAAAAASGIATFDQQGCVSPHAIYIEHDALDAAAFADLLARELADVQRTLPRGELTADEAAAIRRLRTRAEFGSTDADGMRLISAPDDPFTILLHTHAGFEPSCLQRTVHVYPVTDIESALAALTPYRHLLQSAAVAGGDDDLRLRIAQSGFTRITSFDRMPWPDPAGHHDGHGPLLELLRTVSVEDS